MDDVFGAAALEELLSDAARRASRYLSGLADRAVAPDPAALAALDRFAEPLPDGPSDPSGTLALLDEAGSPATVASAGPRYFGFVTGGTLPAALAAGRLAAAWDQNAALPVMSPVAARLHEVTRAWLVELLGLPEGTAAAFVTGATEANTAALAAARDHLLAARGWDVPVRGLFGAPPLTVVLGERAHSTIGKALATLGLGRDRVHRVPADEQGRMLPDRLPDVDGPVLVCAQAGEVNTGACDPLGRIADWTRERGGWLHVDGAFGLWAMAAPGRRHLLEGAQRADSWATDAHKWLNVAYDGGVVLVRDAADLRRSFGSTAGYLPPDDGFEAMHHTPQSSQRARWIEVWAVLRSLGRSGVAELVEGCCRRAARIAGALERGGLRVVNDVVLNQALVVAPSGADATRRMIAAVQRDGTCWCGPGTWAGGTAMRVSVSGWATTDDDADRSAQAILRCARAVGALG
ncbi:MAG: pyridoxal-dependent decarboxylase [Actinomycetota bacterium]|nr:pyridoxal-dependent decarboxylase [Actinomycetota bacterium]